MVTQDNRLLPLSSGELDRPLRDLTQPATIAAPFADSTHLREYLAIVLKRMWLILGLIVVVTSLVAIQMYRLPSIYEAETQIQIQQKQRSVLQTKDIVINSGYDPAYWNTQLKLLENPQLARQVVMTLDLQNNPAFLGGQSGTSIFSSIRRIFSKAKPEAPQQEGGVPVATDATEVNNENLTPEQAARLEPYEDALRGNLTVDPVDKTNLVYIRFKHTNPEIAMKVTNTLADVFRTNDIRRETIGSVKAADMLARQIADLQIKIQQKEEERINYLKNHNLPLGQKKGQDLVAERLSTLSAQALEAERVRKDLQANYEAALREGKVDLWSIPEVQGDPRAQKLRERISDIEQSKDNRIADLEQAKEELLVQYTEEWPEVKKINRRIERIKKDTEQTKRLSKELEKSPQEILRSLKSKYEAAVEKETKLRQAYAQERSQANQQSLDQVALSNIEQELETNKQLLNTYLQRQKELQITSYDKQNNVSIANPARLPHAPVGPARVRNIIIAALLSLVAGIGLAFLLEYLDDTLKSIEDVDRHIHLPTLALIPAPRSEHRWSLKGKAHAAPEGGETSTALALIENARSPIAESYRHLRTSLLLSSAGQPPKTILVTSGQPSEGKTTTAVNTAVMLAQTGADVLIVDCDLRRPRIHSHFNVPNTRGMTNYLSGETNIDSLIQTYEKQPNLKVMTSGPVPPNPAELLGSDQMRRLLHQLSERFTHIIIDSPPAISFTDASILSTQVDGVMLVVHGGRSSRALVRRLKQQLLDVGAHIFGVVLNNVNLESQGKYYGYYYYYYSNYYSSYYGSSNYEGTPDAETASAGESGTKG